MSNLPKIIFHIDLNCFFASCEIAENDNYKNKPLAVAPSDPLRRGIILSPSYEARNYGIKTTMIVKDALLLCKDLIVVPPQMELYKEYSRKFFDYLFTVTPNIEIASIDEGYLDVTDVCRDVHPLALAERIQKDVLEKCKLPCSIGIGPNKFLAKMASDYKKPLGITVFRKREIDKNLWLLPIEKMHGVGKKTAPKLRAIGIATIGDLANFRDMELLKETLGPAYAESLVYHANGGGSTEIDANNFSESQSVSNAHTFANVVYDGALLKKTLKVIANTVSYRLQKANQKAQTIGIILRYADMKQINRSRGLAEPTNEASVIYEVAEEIFTDYFNTGDRIRLIGIFAHRLSSTGEEVTQISIFDNFDKIAQEARINDLVKNLQAKFGKDQINRGYIETKNENAERT